MTTCRRWTTPRRTRPSRRASPRAAPASWRGRRICTPRSASASGTGRASPNGSRPWSGSPMPSPPAELLARRERECRLDPAFALRSVDEAAEWVRERGIVTLTHSCALPSLFAACHQPPYREGARGFGAWPRDAYWWPSALAEEAGIHGLAILRGRHVLV